MEPLQAGAFIALFLMVLGSYVSNFNTNNHLASKINELRVEIADRLARIETVLKITRKE